MFGQRFYQTLLIVCNVQQISFFGWKWIFISVHVVLSSFLEIWHIVMHIELNWIYYLHRRPCFEFFFSNSKKLKHGWLSTNLWLEIISEPSINCHYRWGHFLKWKIRTILQSVIFQDSVSAKQFVERGKLVTTVHQLMQVFTVSVYGSTRPRAVGPGLTIFFNLVSYLVITQSWTRNEPWLAYFLQ